MSDLLARAQAALKKAEQDTLNWPGPCHQCKYWKSWLGGVSNFDYCTNELARLETFTPHGGYDVKLPECANVRSQKGMCGPEGKLFEPKTTAVIAKNIAKKGFWAWLLGK